MAAELAFLAEHVSKTYGVHRALDAVDLKVERGEMVALIGPSGSGKSTLLRALSGLVRIDKGGRIETGGLVIQTDGQLTDKVRQARARTGFIFQQFNLVTRLSLFSNVMIGCLARTPGWRGALGLWAQADKLRALEALRRVGIADLAAQRANALSGGQQQRGAIARTLVQGADSILADEPVASLDPVSARRVMAALAELNADDRMTVVVSLHHVEYAVRYCRRVVALKAGRIIYDGAPAGLSPPMLVDIYGPEVEDAPGPGALSEPDETEKLRR